MEVKYQSANGRFGLVVEARDQQTAFKEIAAFQEVFEGDPVMINGKEVPPEHIKLRVRTVDKYEFFEKVYCGPDKELWGYKMEFGCSNENKGALFPKRKDKDGNYIGNGGWSKFTADSKNDSPKEETTKSSKAPF